MLFKSESVGILSVCIDDGRLRRILRQGGDLGEAAASSSGVGVPGAIDILPLEDSNGGIFRLAGILSVFEVVIIGCISGCVVL